MSKTNSIRIHNCHVHIFGHQHVPECLLPFPLNLAATLIPRKWLARYMYSRRTDDPQKERYAHYILLGNNTQENIFSFLKDFYYPGESRFNVLSIDFSYMRAGKIRCDFETQVEELVELKLKHEKILNLFLCVDPRRPQLLQMVEKYTGNGAKGVFSGLKLYPPLGYYPQDQRLEEIYSYAEEKGLPVITHTETNQPFMYYKGSKKTLLEQIIRGSELITCDPASLSEAEKEAIEAFRKDIQAPEFTRLNRHKMCNYLSHPVNYIPILKRFPKLKICMGHFGGKHEWSRYLELPIPTLLDDQSPGFLREYKKRNWLWLILKLLPQYENLYVDVSGIMGYSKFYGLLKLIWNDPSIRLNEKILFGSDYYMLHSETLEQKYSIDLRALLGEENFRRMAETNPETFLGLPPS